MNFDQDHPSYPHPKIRRKGDSYVIKFTALNPKRMQHIQNLILSPAHRAWRIALCLLILELPISFFSGWDFFRELAFTRSQAYTAIALLWGAWHLDRATRYRSWHIVFGHRIRIHANHGRLRIRKGLFSRELKADLTDSPTFELYSITGNGQEDAYRYAQRMCLIEHGTIRTIVADFLDPMVAGRAFANARAMLEQTNPCETYDIDRTYRHI